MRRRREEWARHVRRWRRSGLTAREFAASAGINPSTLAHWGWRLGRDAGGGQTPRKRAVASKPKTATSFVEILGEAIADDRFEVELAGGRRLRIPARFDRSALEQLLAVLEVGR